MYSVGTSILYNPCSDYLDLVCLLQPPCQYLQAFCRVSAAFYADGKKSSSPSSSSSSPLPSTRVVKGRQRLGDLAPIISLLLKYATASQCVLILRQFRSPRWQSNRQVLWSGVPQNVAQKWADEHSMQMLTTAMGALYNKKDPSCPCHHISGHAWSLFMKAVSALFAWCISQSESVSIVSPPPEDRFHPSGGTNFQVIEFPILQGLYSCATTTRIMAYHPEVPDARDFGYQLWPSDHVHQWTALFGNVSYRRRPWRSIKGVNLALHDGTVSVELSYGGDLVKTCQPGIDSGEENTMASRNSEAKNPKSKKAKQQPKSSEISVRPFSSSSSSNAPDQITLTEMVALIELMELTKQEKPSVVEETEAAKRKDKKSEKAKKAAILKEEKKEKKKKKKKKKKEKKKANEKQEDTQRGGELNSKTQLSQDSKKKGRSKKKKAKDKQGDAQQTSQSNEGNQSSKSSKKKKKKEEKKEKKKTKETINMA